MNETASRYVQLALALGRHDPDYVDSYYGPTEWKALAASEMIPVSRIRAEALAERARLAALPDPVEGPERSRRRFLDRQLEALAARAGLVGGHRMPFDEESRALYDAVAPVYSEDHFRALRSRLEAELPGAGSLAERYDAFRQGFAIPIERLDAVFRTAIAAARAETARHLTLPREERFTVEYVTGKSWSGYNWYQGGFRSLIQVNTDLPIFIDRAIDLACHEGYPGHHVSHTLVEKHLVRERGWIEFAIHPLFSPASLISEGTANYGIGVAFPGRVRSEFERGTLYPLAGLDPERADSYDRVRTLAEELSYASNEAARGYLDGRIDAAAAAAWLTEYALMSSARAQQRVRFIDQYRSYVINYNLGKDLVGRWIEAQVGTAEHRDRHWEVFALLLSEPVLPSELSSEPRAASGRNAAG